MMAKSSFYFKKTRQGIVDKLVLLENAIYSFNRTIYWGEIAWRRIQWFNTWNNKRKLTQTKNAKWRNGSRCENWSATKSTNIKRIEIVNKRLSLCHLWSQHGKFYSLSLSHCVPFVEVTSLNKSSLVVSFLVLCAAAGVFVVTIFICTLVYSNVCVIIVQLEITNGVAM